MFDRKALEALAAYESDSPVVSLYLHLDPRLRATPEAYRARLKGLLREAEDKLPEADQAAIEEYFEQEFDWGGQSAAVFSGQGSGLWQVEQFDVPLRNYVHVGRKPFISPLADMLDTYGAYTVALVDQQTIRMLHFNLGVLDAKATLQGEEVQRLKGGGGAGGAGRRGGDDTSGHVRETVKGNLKQFADALADFCARQRTHSLLLSGTETTVAQFTALLGQPCQDKIKGVFSIPMQAGEAEIQQQSLEVMQTARRAIQDDLVQQIQALSAQKKMGVSGLESTLEAVYAGRVRTLALVEGFSSPGFTCSNCGYATVSEIAECPYCSEKARAVENVSEYAIRRVVEQGGAVEIVDANSALTAVGGIGAMLRY